MPRRKILLIQKIASLFVSLAVLLALLAGVAYYQRGISFEDSNFEAVIRDKLDNPAGPISRSDLLQITHLDASGQDIVSLEGIEKLTRLVYLDLEDNRVADLSPLQNLSRLSGLNLRNNEITCLEEVNFAAITGLPLRSLSLRHNVVRPEEGGQVRLTDISLLSDLTSLEELDLRDNDIADINSLRDLSNLRVLDLRENHIVEISALENLTELTELNLRNNNIEDIAALSNLKSMVILDLRENRIVEISALENLAELTELNLRENEIKDISALSALTNLIYLNLNSNRDIQSVLPLKKLINLETLILRNVPVGDEIVALEGMTALRRLNLRNSEITDTTVLGNLMAVGALQDDVANDLTASVNILDNPLQFQIIDQDVFSPIRDRWSTITERSPFVLPRPLSSVKPPLFSHPGGFYEDPFFLSFEIHDPEVKIYFTLDGSEPCPENTGGSVYHYKNSYPTTPGDPYGELLSRSYQTHLYQNPIYISVRGPGEDFQDCICTINATTIGDQFDPPGDVFRSIVVRAVAHKDGYLPGEVVTHSFFVGEGIKEKYHVPVISLVTDEPNLFDYETGIYVAGKTFDNWREENPEEEAYWKNPANYHQRGNEWERPINIELYNADHALLLNQLSGLRNHGNISRSQPKKSFRLYARELYGTEFFQIQLFQSKETSKFKRFILRNSGNDQASTLFRDALMQSLVRDINLDRQDYQPAVVFVNGQYWGIYNIRDRFDRYYLKYEYGLDPYNVDLLQDNARVREGDDIHYQHMLSYIENNDLLKSYVYEKVNTLMDVESFINLNIAQIYYRNTDWPGNNVDFWRLRTEKYEPDAPYGHDGRWRWMLNDTDFGFGLTGGEDAYTHDTLAFATEADGYEWPNPDWSTFLLRSLLQNDNFMHQFINRFADYMNTIFDSDVVIRQIDAMQDNLAPLMQEQIDRWGQPESYEQWEANVEVMRVFARERPDYVRGHIIDKFNLSGLAEVNLVADSAGGKIRISSIAIDKNTPGIENPSNWTGIYFKDIPITIKAVPNPGYRFVRWEGIESGEQELTVILKEDLILRAIFVKE